MNQVLGVGLLIGLLKQDLKDLLGLLHLQDTLDHVQHPYHVQEPQGYSADLQSLTQDL